MPYPNNDHNNAQNPNWAWEKCWNMARNMTNPNRMRTIIPTYPLAVVLQNLRCHSAMVIDF
jgi:hypothetical protein